MNESKSLNKDNLVAKTNKDHKLIVDNQKKASVTGVVKAVSANPQMVVLQLSHTRVSITGSELYLSKLDVVGGVAEVEGKINAIKYAGNAEQRGFLKRIFK